jgi:hexosaminidase
VFNHHFVPEKFYPRNQLPEPKLDDHKTYIKGVTVVEIKGGHHKASPEAYVLRVESSGTVSIATPSYLGGLHALTTLRQLFYSHSRSSKDVYINCVPVQINDGPTFPHRGLNLDISRNRIYPADALRTLTAMSFCKLNRLHIHATDSQSWPLDIPSMPDLAEKGAYAPEHIWSELDLRAVQKFGAERGIEVYVEIDMPGHMGAVWHSRPELTVAYGSKWDDFAVEPPAGQLKLKNPDVQTFVGHVLDDVLQRTKSFTPLFHLGMDELNLRPYELEEGLGTSDKEKLKPLLQNFLDNVFKHCEQHNVTPMAWEEIVLDWDLDVPTRTIVQNWRNAEALTSVLKKGHRALFGAATHWYLDTGLGTFLDPDPNNPDTTVKPPYHDWIPPYKNFKLMLNYDPLDGVPEDLRSGVLGGECHCWGELTDSVNLDQMLWPRAAAAAEVLWKGKGEVGEKSTRALAEWRERILLEGVRAGMVQMEWILKNKGGGLV